VNKNTQFSEIGPGALQDLITQRVAASEGWLAFDDFMNLALYYPRLGYYVRGAPLFGSLAQGQAISGAPVKVLSQSEGSDFVTAPELTPLFGQALARQVAQALGATHTDEIWEFGAGSGALASQVIDALLSMGVRLRRYTIVDLSGPLRNRQAERLHQHASIVQWVDELPEKMSGVVIGNEVLDAMPVKLLARVAGVWQERGVTVNAAGKLGWLDRGTDLRLPFEPEGSHDYLSELHQQGEAFVATLGEKLVHGAIFLLDYGFPEREYYHPQRHMGTLMCHRAHHADADPLVDVGQKDITAHVNFTGVAVAAQTCGLEVLGYTSQAHFLINCGLAQDMAHAPLRERANANKLIMEHEMGELFKVIGLTRGDWWQALGFTSGDRTPRL